MSRPFLSPSVMGLAVALFAGCGGSTSGGATVDSGTPHDAHATGDTGSHGGHDGGAPADASTGDVSLPADAGRSVSDCSNCATNEDCVVTTAGGGACEMPGDGGLCPNGTKGIPGECCDNTTITTVCWPKGGPCADGLTCACASSLCNNHCPCQGVTDAGVLQCGCEYP